MTTCFGIGRKTDPESVAYWKALDEAADKAMARFGKERPVNKVVDYVKQFAEAVDACREAWHVKAKAQKKLDKAARAYQEAIRAREKAEKALKKHYQDQANMAVRLTKERLSGSSERPLSAALASIEETKGIPSVVGASVKESAKLCKTCRDTGKVLADCDGSAGSIPCPHGCGSLS